MPRSQNSAQVEMNTIWKKLVFRQLCCSSLTTRRWRTSYVGIVKRPWKLVRHGADKYVSREVFTQPNVRLVIFDDQAVEENDRGWLLAQIRKHFSGSSLLYVAGSQSDGNEKRARTNGAHYYVSKPLSLERFGYVLRSFLRTQQAERNDADEIDYLVWLSAGIVRDFGSRDSGLYDLTKPRTF